jgi:hypothetical protein
MVHVILSPMTNVLYFHVVLPEVRVQVPNIAVFCSSSISCVPGMLLRYFLNDFEICYYYYYYY